MPGGRGRGRAARLARERREAAKQARDSLLKTIEEVEQTGSTTISYNLRGLTVLPPQLTRLTNLKRLSLHGNKLKKLPIEITRLTKLDFLDLRGNPLPYPPEILNDPNNPGQLFTYLASLKIARPLNEAKALLVGEADVGKTNVALRLLGQPFREERIKTEGIRIEAMPVKVGRHEVKVHLWDFGGQEIMHSTHQFFLTKRSLYILVIDCTQNEEANRLEYWIKIIQSFGGDAPVLVVGNKRDQHTLDLNRAGLQAKYPQIKGFFEVSCKKGAGITALFDAIRKEIRTMQHVHDMVPAEWFAVKKSLEEMTHDHIPIEHYRRLCEKEGIPQPERQETLIRLLHDLGVMIHFADDPRLMDRNVLKPEWLTSAVYRLLNSAPLAQAHGRLPLAQMPDLLLRRPYPPETHPFLVELMRKFEICYRIEGEADTYLLPDLLPKEEPFLGDGEWDGALQFRYDYDVLPGSVITRFIVRTADLIHKGTEWRTGVLLARDNCLALIKADKEDRTVLVRIKGQAAHRRGFLAVIRAHFEHIHRTISGLEVTEKVPIPNSRLVADYATLLTIEAMGRDEYLPEGGKEYLSVSKLLNGVDTKAERDRRRQDRAPDMGKRSRVDPDVFLSYRRDDSSGYVGRIKEGLEEALPDVEMFQDISSLSPGSKWSGKLEEAVARCRVLVVVIGPGWLNAEKDGKRRVDDPEDWVRREVAAALRMDKSIIPVLVQGAHLPKASELPDEIRALHTHNALVLSDGPHWKADINTLADAIRDAIDG